MGWFARWRQKDALRIEPGRGANLMGALIVLVVVSALAVAAARYGTPGWPRQWRLRVAPPRAWLTGVFWVASAVAVIALAAAFVNGRRWAAARHVRRMSEDRALAPYLTVRPSRPAPRAPVIGPLEVGWRRGGLPSLSRLRRVTSTANVIGRRPLRIVYLRLFENQPRVRTFLQGGWREFGHVHLLRSANSVTPAELRSLKRAGPTDVRFIHDAAQLRVMIDPRADRVDERRLLPIRNVAPSTIWSYDRFGGYRTRALLCHGLFWKDAIDILLASMDLVVLDLSGLTEANAGTLHELQRVIDRVPLRRVVFIADPHSSLSYLRRLIETAWGRMAQGSPNAGPQARRIELHKTDHWTRSGGPRDAQGRTTTPERVRLRAARRRSRRIAALAQQNLARTTV